MGVELTKDSIDLGIVVRDTEASLAFYRDLLGLEHVGEMPMPGGSTMQRLMCGSSLIKLVAHAEPPAARAAPGGLAGASGYRYWTISVSNLEAVTDACREAGCSIPVSPREIRPGIKIAMIEDPDGNWVELLETS
jgi:glyoxylase I family protein